MIIQIDTPKRLVKSIRNLFVDPPPRNKTLHVKRPRMTASGFDVCYEAVGKEYAVAIELPDHLLKKFQEIEADKLAPTICAISMAFAPFLFKLSDFSTVLIDGFVIDKESQQFFAKFLRGGLGEFRYVQGLDPTRAVQVEAAQYRDVTPSKFDTDDHVLMLNGGGKDTVVAGELLTMSGQPFTWVTIRPNQARRSVVELSGNASSIEVGYVLDRNAESRKAYPWGHFPHTSVVLSLGLLVAQLVGARYVCAGNENSANHGNVVHQGFEVNHQYTKSSEYEKGFHDYVTRCVSPDFEVFSILRPFNDLQLARIFSHFKNYHGSFISCNKGISRNEWCKNCPKCAFTALALYPFLETAGYDKIFGEDVMQRPSIRHHILDLTSAKIKPWECVGTREECKLALSLVLERYPGKNFEEKPDLTDLEAALSGFDAKQARNRLLESTSREHLIPDSLVEKLNGALAQLNQPRIV